MKKIHYYLVGVSFILLSFMPACSQESHKEELKRVVKLISTRQYEDAFNLLDSIDPANTGYETVLKKVELALNFHSNTILHELFEFNNLKKGETLATYAKVEGDFKMKDFSIKDRLDSLLILYPTAYELHNVCADFYYSMLKEYPQGWKIKQTELLKLMEDHARKAISKKVANGISYFIVGYTEASKDKHKDAISYYASALHQSPNLAIAYYNLALAQLNLEQPLSALAAIDGAAEYFEDSFNKAESYRLKGFICETLSDDPSAYAHFLTAWKLYPSSLENIHALTEISLRLNKSDYKQYAKTYLETAPEDEEVYRGLVTLFAQYLKIGELQVIFESALAQYEKKPKVLGNLCYFLAGLVHREDKSKAIYYLNSAKTHFAKVLPKSHIIFEAIEEKIVEFSR